MAVATATALARARSLALLMVVARFVPSAACVSAARSSRRRGLHAHQQVRRGIEPPTAQRRSTERGLALVVPPDKLAVDQGGAPFSAEVSLSAPRQLRWFGES
jgi:hypothetical protein